MAVQERAALQAASRARIDSWALASYLLIGLAALAPRVLALGLFITDDEANFWLTRSDMFLNAMRAGDYAATAITAHPGVTTMWLGAAGIVIRRALLDWGILHSDAFPIVLACMRLPAALAHVATVVIGYGLLRRMFSPRVYPALAVLAALLWAADPFVIGYSKLLHTDALAGSFMTLSILAACVYLNHDRRWRWLILSGVAAGLAFLSKSPALVLAPAVGLAGLLSTTKDQGPRTKDQNTVMPQRNFVFGLWSFILPLVAWSALAAATVFALWPALWISPAQAYAQLRIGVEIEGAQPHMLGNFFLGRQDDAPGLLYYPAALVLRTTPWTLLGLLLLPLAWRKLSPPTPGDARDGSVGASRHSLAALAGFVILFVTAMSLFPKKFDRYIVPAFPALDVLAAVGLLGVGSWGLGVGKQLGRESPFDIRRSSFVTGFTGVIAVAALANIAWWHPYSIDAFNQLFGGTCAGTRTFTVGWGEGLEQVADWLNAQPDITSVRTVALRVTSLNRYLRDGAEAVFPSGDKLRDRTGYVVVYLPQTQAGSVDGVFGQFYGRAPPLHTVRIHGVDFAWIYRAPPQVAHPRAAGFGPDIRLLGFDQSGDFRPGETVRLRLSWAAAAPPPADYWLFAHLIGPGGQRYSQIDLPYPTSQWAPGTFAATELPIALPADAPPGAYQLLIGLYDQPTGQRLALTSDTQSAAPAGEENALLLTEFELR
ncbi:MAG TPA: glycosyltransferase family 39 protein [Roseiflexaceae bacterium]|nr:glycosyltransferase family 39 protein [Roseiflexaceae bacterium]